MTTRWRKARSEDPSAKTPAQLQERTDEIVAQMKAEAARAKIITTLIRQRVDLMEAHRGT